MAVVAAVQLYADRSLFVVAAPTLPSPWSPPQRTRRRRRNEAWAGKCDMQHVLYIEHYNMWCLKCWQKSFFSQWTVNKVEFNMRMVGCMSIQKAFQDQKVSFKDQQKYYFHVCPTSPGPPGPVSSYSSCYSRSLVPRSPCGSRRSYIPLPVLPFHVVFEIASITKFDSIHSVCEESLFDPRFAFFLCFGDPKLKRSFDSAAVVRCQFVP